ncbi:MAG: hypothetical protein HQK53_03830 [Oligoflexia bacterium]|nr:hypothetical protein [Oligoflexia bacterium]
MRVNRDALFEELKGRWEQNYQLAIMGTTMGTSVGMADQVAKGSSIRNFRILEKMDNRVFDFMGMFRPSTQEIGKLLTLIGSDDLSLLRETAFIANLNDSSTRLMVITSLLKHSIVGVEAERMLMRLAKELTSEDSVALLLQIIEQKRQLFYPFARDFLEKFSELNEQTRTQILYTVINSNSHDFYDLVKNDNITSLLLTNRISLLSLAIKKGVIAVHTLINSSDFQLFTSEEHYQILVEILRSSAEELYPLLSDEVFDNLDYRQQESILKSIVTGKKKNLYRFLQKEKFFRNSLNWSQRTEILQLIISQKNNELFPLVETTLKINGSGEALRGISDFYRSLILMEIINKRVDDLYYLISGSEFFPTYSLTVKRELINKIFNNFPQLPQLHGMINNENMSLLTNEDRISIVGDIIFHKVSDLYFIVTPKLFSQVPLSIKVRLLDIILSEGISAFYPLLIANYPLLKEDIIIATVNRKIKEFYPLILQKVSFEDISGYVWPGTVYQGIIENKITELYPFLLNNYDSFEVYARDSRYPRGLELIKKEIEKTTAPVLLPMPLPAPLPLARPSLPAKSTPQSCNIL